MHWILVLLLGRSDFRKNSADEQVSVQMNGTVNNSRPLGSGPIAQNEIVKIWQFRIGNTEKGQKQNG